MSSFNAGHNVLNGVVVAKVSVEEFHRKYGISRTDLESAAETVVTA